MTDTKYLLNLLVVIQHGHHLHAKNEALCLYYGFHILEKAMNYKSIEED